MPEYDIRRILSQDLSVGTEAFRDALLARCIEALGSGSAGECIDLSEDELELLAAAGFTEGLAPLESWGDATS